MIDRQGHLPGGLQSDIAEFLTDVFTEQAGRSSMQKVHAFSAGLSPRTILRRYGYGLATTETLYLPGALQIDNTHIRSI